MEEDAQIQIPMVKINIKREQDPESDDDDTETTKTIKQEPLEEEHSSHQEEEPNNHEEQIVNIKEEPAFDIEDDDELPPPDSDEDYELDIKQEQSDEDSDFSESSSSQANSKAKSRRVEKREPEIEVIKVHECNECGESFLGFSEYRKHSITHITDLYCNWCMKLYTNKRTWLQHLFHRHFEKFTCHLCITTFISFEGLEIHMEEEHKDIPRSEPNHLTCYLCNRSFSRKEVVQSHTERCHQRKCGECNKTFKERPVITDHFFEEHFPKYLDDEVIPASKEENEYVKLERGTAICNICKRSFNAEFHLKRHFERWHPDNELKMTFKCLQCKQIFDTVENLQDHRSRVHGEKRTFECKVCKETFGRKNALSLHVKKAHPTVKIEPQERQCSGENTEARCRICKHVFTKFRQYNLELHFKIIHPGRRMNVEYRCKDCDECFRSFNEAGNHEYHPKEQKVRCNVCSKVFKSMAPLEKHFEDNHPDSILVIEYKCPDCDDFFLSPQDVEIHKIVAHNPDDPSSQKYLTSIKCIACQVELPVNRISKHYKSAHPNFDFEPYREFQCFICSNYFKTLNELLEHKKTHLREPVKRKWKSVIARCNACNLLFDRRFSPERHFRIMHPDMELDIGYKCDFCEEFFKSREEVGLHEEIAHKCKSYPGNSKDYDLLLESEGSKAYVPNYNVKKMTKIEPTTESSDMVFSIFEVEGEALNVKQELEDL